MFQKDLLTAHEPHQVESSMECAGRAQRRRRFGVGRAFRSRNKTGSRYAYERRMDFLIA
jgi:hypothetical protein